MTTLKTTPKTKPARRAKAVEPPRQQRAARRRAASAATATPEQASQPAPASDEAPANPTPAKGPGGKLGVVVALMRRPEGATLAQMSEATGWLAHSVRGAIAGSLKRKHRLTINSERGQGRRVYRIAGDRPA